MAGQCALGMSVEKQSIVTPWPVCLAAALEFGQGRANEISAHFVEIRFTCFFEVT